MAECVNDDGFIVTFPVWVFISPDSIIEDRFGNVGFADKIICRMVENDDGKKTIPLFTDQDSAERFIRDSGLPTDDPMNGFRNAKELIAVLSLASAADFVAFDPIKIPGQGKTWPILYAIEMIEKGIPLQ